MKRFFENLIRFAFFPISIGDYVYIEDDCVINAASIGSYVHIGKGAVIGRRSVLKDCCSIAPNSVVPPETIIPPYSHFSGIPGTLNLIMKQKILI